MSLIACFRALYMLALGAPRICPTRACVLFPVPLLARASSTTSPFSLCCFQGRSTFCVMGAPASSRRTALSQRRHVQRARAVTYAPMFACTRTRTRKVFLKVSSGHTDFTLRTQAGGLSTH